LLTFSFNNTKKSIQEHQKDRQSMLLVPYKGEHSGLD